MNTYLIYLSKKLGLIDEVQKNSLWEIDGEFSPVISLEGEDAYGNSVCVEFRGLGAYRSVNLYIFNEEKGGVYDTFSVMHFALLKKAIDDVVNYYHICVE